MWIAEKFHEEHRAALDWLNEITDDSVDFFGVEIEVYRIGDSDPAPMFNIVSKPNNWSKSVKRNVESTGVTETKSLQLEYWQTLKDFVEKEKATFKMQKPYPQHWTNISVGRAGFQIRVVANSRERFLQVQLIVASNNSIEDFRKLRKDYEEDSKKHLSERIEWSEKEEGAKEHHVNLRFNCDPLDKNDWAKQHTILLEWIENFLQYFKDKIKEL